jgi:Tfp pilus assembly protein PilZ
MKIWVIEPDETCVTSLLKDLAMEMEREGLSPPEPRLEGPLREEKRLYPRVPCFLLVDCATEGSAYRAFVRNLSADGAFIQAHMPVPTGPDISLVISLHEDKNPVRITGQIVWSGEQGIGVRFDPLSQIDFDSPLT